MKIGIIIGAWLVLVLLVLFHVIPPIALIVPLLAVVIYFGVLYVAPNGVGNALARAWGACADAVQDLAKLVGKGDC